MTLSPPNNTIELAARLLGSRPDAVLPLLATGSDRLFRVSTPKRDYALKLYAGLTDEATQTMQREVDALHFLRNGPLAECVPHIVTSDAQEGAALSEWVAGIIPAHRRGSELAQLQRVIASLPIISRGAQAAEFPAARGACARPADLARHIAESRESLRPYEAVVRFARILALFDAYWPSARSALLLPQDPARLVLSPVDFGFHKALLRPDGQLVFFGFTQFGWDDPARLVADLLWNPRLSLTTSEASALGATAHQVFGACDGGFALRLGRLWPAIGLSWALRLLNDARSARRSAVVRLSQDNVMGRQFDRAEICLRKVEENLHQIAA